jgi:monovalent cation:H+ antiporter-2, CPA2 family
MLFVSGLLIFASPLYRWTEKWLRSDLPLSNTMLPLIFWTGFGLLVIAPLIALWRQVESLAMIAADSATKGTARRSLLQPVFATLLKAVVSIAALVWFATLIPYDVLPAWGMVAVGLFIVSVGVVFWRSLIRLQSRFEIELRAQLSDSPFATGKPQLAGWPKRNGHWKMSLSEVIVREQTEGVGRSVAELALREQFACTIVSIERQGVPISNPDANTILYPNDKVLLLGTEESLQNAERWLNREPANKLERSDEATLGGISLSHLVVPVAFRHIGKSLADLALKSDFGVQIVGIERGTKSMLNPGPSESLEPGDQLLVLGRPNQVTEMAFWLSA